MGTVLSFTRRFDTNNGGLAYIEENESLGHVRAIAAEIGAYDAVPASPILGIKMCLNNTRYFLLRTAFRQGLGGYFHCVGTHVSMFVHVGGN